MKLVANIFYLVAIAIIMVIILAGCNTRHEGTSAGDASTETGLNLPDAEQDSDIPFLDTEEPDAGQEPDAGCDEECQAASVPCSRTDCSTPVSIKIWLSAELLLEA